LLGFRAVSLAFNAFLSVKLTFLHTKSMSAHKIAQYPFYYSYFGGVN